MPCQVTSPGVGGFDFGTMTLIAVVGMTGLLTSIPYLRISGGHRRADGRDGSSSEQVSTSSILSTIRRSLCFADVGFALSCS